jgi:hypothetical protein
MDFNAVVSEALPAKKVVFVLEDVADYVRVLKSSRTQMLSK